MGLLAATTKVMRAPVRSTWASGPPIGSHGHRDLWRLRERHHRVLGRGVGERHHLASALCSPITYL